MGSAVFLYENFADTAILSGGSYETTLPRTNAQTQDVGEVARTVDAANSSTKIRADLGRFQQVGGVAIGPINISPGATWRVKAFSDAGFSSLLYDSGVLTVPGSVVDWSDPDEWLEWEDVGFWYGIDDSGLFPELQNWLVHVVADPQDPDALAQFWQVEIFDESNSDGYIQYGRLLISRTLRPSINYDEGNALGIVALTDVTESLGGKRTYWERGLRRTWRASFNNQSQTELFGEWFRAMVRLRTSRQVFVVPDPDDTTNFLKRSFLATCREPPALQQLLVDRGATAVDLEEVI